MLSGASDTRNRDGLDDPAPALPRASVIDGLRVVTQVLGPVAAGGAIVRRPRMLRAAQKADLDARAVRTMQRLRDRYGPGPVQIRLPRRRFTVVLDPDDVHRVLNESPEPFSPSTREKRGALGHFQPEGVLISSPEERRIRRPFNERVLQPERSVHSHGEHMAQVVEREISALLGHAEFTGVLDWDGFIVAWQRMVRRIVLGDSAREDHAVTDELLWLRQRANWSFLAPTRRRRRRHFLNRLAHYVQRTEPGSLAHMVAATPAPPGSAPHPQIPQWLFAFDAAAWATYRALALLVTHPEASRRARQEAGSAEGPVARLPFLRATILESLRLWPTTPAILRDTTTVTTWAAGRTLPEGASVILFAPFFHRDETALDEAHRFSPHLWLSDRTDQHWPLVPFSGGQGMCPGRNVVLHTAGNVLGCLLTGAELSLPDPPLDPDRPLPGSLSPFPLRFHLRPGQARQRRSPGGGASRLRSRGAEDVR